jgi:hypothetical protein
MQTSTQSPAAPPAPTVDPNFATEQAQANSANISALQTEAQSDTASLMARYGTKLALAGMSSSASSLASVMNAPMGKT